MSKKKLVPLAGKEFEVYSWLYLPRICTRRSLYDVYKKPSASKVAIYNDWINWFNCCSENTNDFITVDSYNTNFFTLSGVVTINDETYIIKVTASHNCCANVSREFCREVLGWTD